MSSAAMRRTSAPSAWSRLPKTIRIFTRARAGTALLGLVSTRVSFARAAADARHVQHGAFWGRRSSARALIFLLGWWGCLPMYRLQISSMPVLLAQDPERGEWALPGLPSGIFGEALLVRGTVGGRDGQAQGREEAEEGPEATERRRDAVCEMK